jgi:hypothetical protein
MRGFFYSMHERPYSLAGVISAEPSPATMPGITIVAWNVLIGLGAMHSCISVAQEQRQGTTKIIGVRREKLPPEGPFAPPRQGSRTHSTIAVPCLEQALWQCQSKPQHRKPYPFRSPRALTGIGDRQRGGRDSAPWWTPR